jgi:hypothetical protein
MFPSRTPLGTFPTFQFKNIITWPPLLINTFNSISLVWNPHFIKLFNQVWHLAILLCINTFMFLKKISIELDSLSATQLKPNCMKDAINKNEKVSEFLHVSRPFQANRREGGKP